MSDIDLKSRYDIGWFSAYDTLKGMVILYGYSKVLEALMEIGNLTPDAADGAKAGETLRYWQHDETGRQCARAQRPSPRWFEITQGQYDGSDDDYPAKPPRR